MREPAVVSGLARGVAPVRLQNDEKTHPEHDRDEREDEERQSPAKRAEVHHAITLA